MEHLMSDILDNNKSIYSIINKYDYTMIFDSLIIHVKHKNIIKIMIKIYKYYINECDTLDFHKRYNVLMNMILEINEFY